MPVREKATILDIAREAGVSKSTVSLVLQGSGLIRPETAGKVRKAIEDVGYVYNRGAANLRKAHSNVIGMVINDLTNPFFAELAVGMERVFQSAGVVPFIANTAENPVRQEEVLKSMMEQGVAGLIVSPARGTTAEAFRRMQQAGIPVVLAMRRLREGRVPTVVPDNHRGAALAAAHLIRKGHRRLAFFGGFSDMVVYHERSDGFREGCETNGIALEDMTIVEGETNRKGGMACLDTALSLPNPPTAAVCFNDAVAFGVMLALRKRGLEPGRDFAVVGFDDVIEAETAVPALTTVSVDPQGMGRRAAQMVLKQINAGRAEPEAVVSSVRLMVRQSCGAGTAGEQRRISA